MPPRFLRHFDPLPAISYITLVSLLRFDQPIKQPAMDTSPRTAQDLKSQANELEQLRAYIERRRRMLDDRHRAWEDACIAREAELDRLQADLEQQRQTLDDERRRWELEFAAQREELNRLRRETQGAAEGVQPPAPDPRLTTPVNAPNADYSRVL